MRLYNRQHPLHCGIDLHARMMYVCILNQAGETLLHRNLKTTPETFLKVIAPYRPDIVVAVECMLTWYWLADLCAEEEIPFVLGHALYMKAIHSPAVHDVEQMRGKQLKAASGSSPLASAIQTRSAMDG